MNEIGMSTRNESEQQLSREMNAHLSYFHDTEITICSLASPTRKQSTKGNLGLTLIRRWVFDLKIEMLFFETPRSHFFQLTLT